MHGRWLWYQTVLFYQVPITLIGSHFRNGGKPRENRRMSEEDMHWYLEDVLDKAVIGCWGSKLKSLISWKPCIHQILTCLYGYPFKRSRSRALSCFSYCTHQKKGISCGCPCVAFAMVHLWMMIFFLHLWRARAESSWATKLLSLLLGVVVSLICELKAKK